MDLFSKHKKVFTFAIDKIIPVSIALDSSSQESPQLHADTSFGSSKQFLSKSSPSNSNSSSEDPKSLSVSSEKLVKTQKQGNLLKGIDN